MAPKRSSPNKRPKPPTDVKVIEFVKEAVFDLTKATVEEKRVYYTKRAAECTETIRKANAELDIWMAELDALTVVDDDDYVLP